MKGRVRIIVLLLALGAVCAGDLTAQHYIGVRGGYGGGTARFDYSGLSQSRETEFLFGWPSGGVSWKYYSPHRVVGGIQVDLQVVKKGFRELSNPRQIDEEVIYQDFYERTLSAIELPFMWQPHVYVFNRKARIYINLGVYLAYIFDSTEQSGKTDGSETGPKVKYKMKSVRDNQFEYGLCGGFGFSYLFGRFEAFAEARYNFGYSDILKARAKYPLNPYNRTPVDMLNFSMGVYYRLGKGGILSPPASKDKIKKAGWQDMPPPPANRDRSSGSGSSNPGSPRSSGGTSGLNTQPPRR